MTLSGLVVTYPYVFPQSSSHIPQPIAGHEAGRFVPSTVNNMAMYIDSKKKRMNAIFNYSEAERVFCLC
jgi:hypothetical protein